LDSLKKEDIQFENHEDDFINGTFGEELGIDMLNMKEIGLDFGFVNTI
jgi:hypothetical protein